MYAKPYMCQESVLTTELDDKDFYAPGSPASIFWNNFPPNSIGKETDGEIHLSPA
jgi:hypothetical protein